MQSKYDPEGTRLPIKIDSTSNGEYSPIAISPVNDAGNKLAYSYVDENSKRSAVSRRKFMVSACGAASTLLAHNLVNAEAGKTGGFFNVPADAALDQDIAQASLQGNEFIFDVQGHFVDPTGTWLQKVKPGATPFKWSNKTSCAKADADKPFAYLDCLAPDEFIKDVFLDSDTDMMVLSLVPSKRDSEPVTIETAAQTRDIVEKMEGTHRLLLHGRVNPNQPGDMEDMPELAEKWQVSAWKTYTQWGPEGKGFYLHDDIGLQFIEEARRLGIKVICIHKGIPFSKKSYEHSQCQDIGKVAKLFPDVSFIIYHSGFVPGHAEQAFQPGAGTDGVDTLIQSILDNDVQPNSNVYAELGSTWRYVMRDPDLAAHTMGKLLKYVGEDNVLWGTDSIWYGSPQDQIQAFRTFQISTQFQEQYGYPEITPQIRAKVFGLNAMVPLQDFSRGDADDGSQ